MPKPSRTYIITHFEDNINEERFEQICQQLSHFRGAIGQVEQCPETKKEHLQLYVEFSKPVRPSAIQKIMHGAHCEYRRGTVQEAQDYCSKEDTRLRGPWSSGQMSPGQGFRSDLESIREEIKEGKTELQIAEGHFANWARYYKAFIRYANLLIQPRNWATEVHILWGSPGTGKTRSVYDLYGQDRIYSVPRSGGGPVWFDGYDGRRHDVVLIDDFYGWIPLNFLLPMCDRYPFQVPVKGSFIEFVPKYIYFTSNKPWTDWYQWEEERLMPLKPAFERRITSKTHFI